MKENRKKTRLKCKTYRVNEVKFVCVITDESMTWKQTISKLKIAESAVLLYKVKEFLNDKALYMQYNVMIVPI